ncbi:hypothetical protein GQ53DRAFT_461675 [Thozetella sp. PMI_491]|nr:hypothetical protein GQ53DRAFT_461675 [Thozetella sp. PMI_491]
MKMPIHRKARLVFPNLGRLLDAEPGLSQPASFSMPRRTGFSFRFEASIGEDLLVPWLLPPTLPPGRGSRAIPCLAGNIHEERKKKKKKKNQATRGFPAEGRVALGPHLRDLKFQAVPPPVALWRNLDPGRGQRPSPVSPEVPSRLLPHTYRAVGPAPVVGLRAALARRRNDFSEHRWASLFFHQPTHPNRVLHLEIAVSPYGYSGAEIDRKIDPSLPPPPRRHLHTHALSNPLSCGFVH